MRRKHYTVTPNEVAEVAKEFDNLAIAGMEIAQLRADLLLAQGQAAAVQAFADSVLKRRNEAFAKIRKVLDQQVALGEEYEYRQPSSFLGDRVQMVITSRRGDLCDMRLAVENILNENTR